MPPEHKEEVDNMPHPEPIITSVSSLDWPTDDDAVEDTIIQCAGKSYLAYESRLLNRRDFLHTSSFYQSENGGNDAASPLGGTEGGDNGEKKKEYDLLTMSERKLGKLSYYQVLHRTLPMHASTEEIRKAYHKACLKYHPDKTGRGEEDEVFLLVKAAFDTLSDPMKRRSYDSTVDFDESIPKEGVKEEEFYTVYGPVFHRNMRFASCNDPAKGSKVEGETPTPKKKGKNKNKKNRNNNNNDAKSQSPSSGRPPLFGDDATPLSQVHAFYDFWIHFDSWRDFTLKAAEEAEHDVDSADCREEKRWMKQEIDRKMKKMKRDEMARVNSLVERAMAVDPRLKREKERLVTEKKQKEEVKKKAEKEKAEKERKEREIMEKQMATKKAEEESKKKGAKKIKEQQKKQLRKAKQLFRKLSMSAYQATNPNDNSIGNDAVWDDLEKMNDDIELLCDKLSVMELSSLNDILGGPEAVEEDSNASVCVEALAEVKQCAEETAAGAERQSLVDIQQRNQARKEAAEKARVAKLAKASSPWSKEELSALAKGVKKYPPGGSNRWDAIASYINNLCRQPDPRTKEDCIEKYNQIASTAGPASAETTKPTPPADASSGGDSNVKDGDDEVWTEEQDALLQEMLRKYPASMEKNERWKSIAKGVPGRNKKECVQRFKAIRDAVRQGKN
eukprot:CAMPEP_0201670286 /NCGR_PEP_ID=MMETSP0494-20130426/26347_1 /ASSEMBLY_ACC=CAM_ASM_000839 /TAXON_ID=420259 /ORGANISM="Thalassiosira gravida, Strain GMp14c1" /LENGTH=674 /DNA_ID=CAMNT_0048151303 /DNA_START=60 /DNA_END=2084 /DNA_ORIENTATION=-